MQNTALHKRFFQYALPSMMSQLLNSCFIIVDGFFIGQNLGDVGLAAINVAWPITALIQAISLGLGIGGSVRMATALGKNDLQEARRARGNTLLMLLVSTVVLGLGLTLASPYILPLIGANEELYPLALEYTRVICMLSVGQIMTTGTLPLLRGSGKTIHAMVYMIVGLIGNIVMDWLFIQVFQWGLAGAALATTMAQIFCACMTIPTLLTQKSWPITRSEFRPHKEMLQGILHYGISPFGLSLSTSVILLITNLRALEYGGTTGVAIYAVLSYVIGSVVPLVTGVGDGIQPLLSYAKGAHDLNSLAKLRRWGLYLAVSIALFCSVLTMVLRHQLPLLFGAGEEAALQGANAMWTLALGYPFMAIVRFCSSYFCAVGQPLASGILAYGEPLIAQPTFLFIVPLFLQLTGVWVAYPAAVAVMAAVALWLLYRQIQQTETLEP